VWSPDGKSIVFLYTRQGGRDLYRKDASGAGDDALLLKTGRGKIPSAISRDGRFLIYREQTTEFWDLWFLSLTGETPASVYLNSPFIESDAAVSPDGRWAAYESNESGSIEIYTQTFPSPGGKKQVSASGGNDYDPKWRRDGKELFYVTAEGDLMSVEVHPGDTLSFGIPTPLFRTAVVPIASRNVYDVSPDGRRFVVAVETSTVNAESRIVVVLNWPALLR
jgi:Tol biopolymer transport system component